MFTAKKLWSLILTVCMLLSVVPFGTIIASAQSTTDDGFVYTEVENGIEITDYTGDSTNLSIPSKIDNKDVVSIGSRAFQFCRAVTSVSIPDGVTSIGSSAFYGCSSLTSISIPDSVTSIGGQVFYDCTSLECITVDENNANFRSIDDVLYSIRDNSLYSIICYPAKKTNESFTIPEGVITINANAIRYCTSLASISIPDSVTSIDNSAFEGCEKLEYITVSEHNSNYLSVDGVLYNKSKESLICYPAGKANKEFSIPNSVTSIGSSAFYGCSSLASISIPNNVTSIGYWAFIGCSSLASISIPDSVTSIGDRAFEDCTSLTSITIPAGVTSIGHCTFNNCTSLTSISIPNSVTSIGDAVFDGCSSLVSISIPDSVTSIGGSAFYGCSSLASISIPNSVTSIGNFAFSYCSSLTSISIPGSVTSIGVGAFAICSSLASITIPNGVKSIERQAFTGCSSLASITIPNSVTSIDNIAFYMCKNITIYCYQDSYAQSFAETNNIPYKLLTEEDSINRLTYEDIEGGVMITGFEGNSDILTIPAEIDGKTVVAIDAGAFANATKIKTVNYEAIDAVCYGTKTNTVFPAKQVMTVNIGKDVKTIPSYLFYGAYVTRLNFADDCVLETIGSYSFYMSRIDTLSIPDSVKIIGDQSFRGSVNLKEITLGEKVESIGAWAFAYTTKLETVLLNTELYKIDNYAFYSTNLDSITIPHSVGYIGRVDPFGNTDTIIYAYTDSLAAQKYADAYIDLGIYYTEVNVADLTYEEINDEIKITGFTGEFTKYMEIPAEIEGKPVVEIGWKAFFNGTANKTVYAIKLPASVTKIGGQAFRALVHLHTFEAEGASNISSSAFMYCSNLNND